MADIPIGIVDYSAFVIGGGLLDNRKYARVTVVIKPGPSCDWVTLAYWPSRGHGILNKGAVTAQRFDEYRCAVTPGTPTPLDQIGRNTFDRDLGGLDALWQRAILSIPEAQAQITDVLNFWNQGSDSTQTFEAKAASGGFIALPSLEAGLILPLERARQVMDAIAPADAPIRGRSPLRPPGWVPPPLAQGRFDWSVNFSSMSDLKGKASFDQGQLAQKIVRDGDSSVFEIIQTMHARHHLAMHPFTASRDLTHLSAPLPSTDQLTDPLRSRLSHLMGSPVLMRIFGFARDLIVEVPSGSTYWALGFTADEKSSAKQSVSPGCVVKLGASFSPASRADFKNASSQPSPESDGVLLLDPNRYALITLDPATALEGDANHYRHQANLAVQGKSEPPPSPATGGLSLARTLAVHPLAETDPGTPSTDYAFAEDLVTFNRLDIGIVTDDNDTVWRCPGHKVTTWSDPSKYAFDMEDALNALEGADGLPRFELEAAIFSDRASVTQTEGVHFADTRLVTYNGEPLAIGLNQIYWPDPTKGPCWQRPTLSLDREKGYIPLDQDSRLPSAKEEGQGALLPLLRFGLEFRAGVRRVYLGGVSLSLAQATKIYTNQQLPNACLPDPGRSGFRFLRHEAIAPPLVALGPQLPKSLDRENWLQTPLNVALVSWDDYRTDPGKAAKIPKGHVEVLHTERVLIPPTVDLHFAMLHEVFDDLEQGQNMPVRRTALPQDGAAFPPPDGSTPTNKNAHTYILSAKPPADGLQRLNLGKVLRPAQPAEPKSTAASLGGKSDPTAGYSKIKVPSMGLPRIEALRAGETNDRQVPYYPDPAAATMMFALRLPDAPNGDWLEPPQAARVRSDTSNWPDVLPIYLKVIAGHVAAGKPRMQVGGPVNLGALGGQRVVPVTITLPKAEIATLVVWLVPDVADLADWFDVVEQISSILNNSNSDNGDDISPTPKRGAGDRSTSRCAQAAANLLGAAAAQRFEAILDPADQRNAIAGMLAEALRHQPIPQIAQPQQVALSHLVPVTLDAPRFDQQSPLALARRLATDDAAVAQFLGASAPTVDWAGAYDEDGALQPIVGGTVEFDPASTSGLVFSARLVAPTGAIDTGPAPTSPNVMPSDPSRPKFTWAKNGSVDLTPLRGDIEFLRIDGIPYPADGRRGLRRYELRDLQLEAFNAPQGGIQVKRGAPLQDGGARHMDLFVRLVPRHLPQLERPALAIAGKVESAVADQLDISKWLPCGNSILRATIRPASPDVRELVPSFRWQGDAQTGSGEISWRVDRYTTFRLILRRPWFSSGEDEQLGIIFWPPQVLDGTPKKLDPATLSLFQEEDLGPIGRYVSAWGRDPIRPLDGSPEPGGFMLSPDAFPISETTLANGRDILPTWQPTVAVPIIGTSDDSKTETAAFVGLRTFPVSYDPDRGGHWFVDIEPELPAVSDGFIRLGVVRWQPHARLDGPRAGSMLSSLRCSPPSTAWAPVAPRRTLSVSASSAPGSTKASPEVQITVQLRGPAGSVPAGSLLPSILVRMRILKVEGAKTSVARDKNGAKLAAGTDADATSGKNLSPVLHMKQGIDVLWIASFLVPIPLQDLDAHYHVVVEEYEAMPDADDSDDDPSGHRPSRGAMRFFAIFPLEPGTLPEIL